MNQKTNKTKKTKTVSNQDVMETMGVVCAMLGEARANLGTLTTIAAYGHGNGTGLVITSDATRKLIDEAIHKNVELILSVTPPSVDI